MSQPDPYQLVDFPSAAASPNYRLSLLCLLLIKAALMVYVIIFSGIGLGPDEAQYWTWSQHLDWAYYSKPPGIAWEIFLGTYLFGSTEIGVRFGALGIGFLLPWATYYLAKSCGLRSATAFWAGTIMAASPLGILASLFATTDGGFVLFWTVGLAIAMSGVRRQTSPNYVLIGLCILCGGLFKWTTFTLWGVIAAIAYFLPHWRNWKLIPGVIISLLAFIPSIIWNSTHQWATFRHVWSTNIVGQKTSLIPFSGNLFDFLGAQVGLFSPIFAVLLVLAYITIWKQKAKVPLPIAFCGYISATIFLVYLFLSLFKKMQGNWCVYAYAPAMVTVCWYACDWLLSGKPWLFAGTLLSAFFTAVTLCIPNIQANNNGGTFALPYSMNPFQHNLGWKRLEKELRVSNFDPDQDFLFGSRYQTTSILSFYNEEQKRAYFFNVDQNRKNQFSYWPGMEEEQIGHTGFFVEVENGKQVDEPLGPKVRRVKTMLRPYFRQVQFLGRRPLFTANDKIVKNALIFQCFEYNGSAPEDSQKY